MQTSMVSMNNINMFITDDDKVCKRVIILVKLLQVMIMSIVIPMNI
jgi:hypothetical protein